MSHSLATGQSPGMRDRSRNDGPRNCSRWPLGWTYVSLVDPEPLRLKAAGTDVLTRLGGGKVQAVRHAHQAHTCSRRSGKLKSR
jgi:hypothetical protein